VAAGFAGLLLGWSLQAPVSGMAAWALITLKRPFRVGDRVLVPSLGLSGDVMDIGVMYTRLNQVGGTIGSEEAIGRSILIPNAMLFTQVVINYTPQQEAAQFLDEVIVRITFDSDWDAAEQILLDAAREVTADIIAKTGQQPYIRSDNYDYGIYMRLRYMTEAMDRPRITHEITKRIFQAFQRNPKVDLAIPYVYSYRKSATEQRFQFPEPVQQPEEIPVAEVMDDEGEPLPPERDAKVSELAASITEVGLLQPIMVAREADGRYRILAGEDRFRACKRLGWTRIPAIVKRETA
jgi:small-conductance mechanosensitive channel